MFKTNPLYSWLLLILISLIWGSSFILMKKGLEGFTYTQVAAMRIFITSIILLPFAIPGIKKISFRYFKNLFWLGLFGTGIPPFLFTKAQTVVDSSTAGILNALTPLFTLVIGIIFFKTKLNYLKLSGVIIGFIGAICLILLKDASSVNLHLYSFLIVLATLMYGISGNVVNSKLQGLNPLQITSLSFLLLGIPAGLVLLFSGVEKNFILNPNAVPSFLYILILAVIGTALANLIFYKLMHNSNLIFAQSVTYLIPVVSIMWGFLDGESMQISDFLGIALILSGIYLINKPQKEVKRE